MTAGSRVNFFQDQLSLLGGDASLKDAFPGNNIPCTTGINQLLCFQSQVLRLSATKLVKMRKEVIYLGVRRPSSEIKFAIQRKTKKFVVVNFPTVM